MISLLLSYFALSVGLSVISRVTTRSWISIPAGALSAGFMGASTLALGAVLVYATPQSWIFALICAFGTSLELRHTYSQRAGARS
jgi:hypothetical protein